MGIWAYAKMTKQSWELIHVGSTGQVIVPKPQILADASFAEIGLAEHAPYTCRSSAECFLRRVHSARPLFKFAKCENRTIDMSCYVM